MAFFALLRRNCLGQLHFFAKFYKQQSNFGILEYFFYTKHLFLKAETTVIKLFPKAADNLGFFLTQFLSGFPK